MTLKEKTENLYKQLTADSNSFINVLFAQLDPLVVAIERYSKKGEIDAETLKLNKEQITILEASKEKRPGRRRKKLFPVDDNAATTGTVKIKKEKVSLLKPPNPDVSTTSNEEATKENTNVDGMPAPSWIPPKKKVKEIKTERTSVRPTRTKGKNAAVERDSDLMIQNTTITTVTLTDTDESEDSNSQKETRSTRTKTNKQQTKETEESDTDSKRSTRTKTNKKKKDVAEEVVEEKRSTRTKTIKKAATTEQELPHVDEVLEEKRSTRTKNLKKVPSQEEVAPEPEEARSTRTKTTKKAQKVEENAPEATRSTRTKAKKQVEKEPEKLEETEKPKHKRGRSDSSGDETEMERKKTKSKSPVREKANSSAHTVYEDAQSNLGPVQDAAVNSTFVKESEPHSAPVNCTVVVDKANFNIFQKQPEEPFLTDDDSMETKSPPKKEPPQKGKKTPGKEVFSPYEKTTLKKKVEAFEKLQNTSEIPVSKKASQSFKGTPASVKQKARMFTPSGIKFLPVNCSTSKSVSKTISHTAASTSFLGSTNDTLGSASIDPRERQRKILERDQALKKKEALLQAQSEAKRKLNQEKQIKAQQQRKIMEVEKLRLVEQQKQKEEKMKQREREREEHLQKQKMEQEKKRMAQKMRLQAQKQENATKPIYMVTPLPTLPTGDCYDSDDPNYVKAQEPSWSIDKQWRRRQQITMLAAGERIKNTLFCVHAQTPNLIEIFETIDERKLKRSSSQMWRKPPRYTMMPDLNETKFSDDEVDSD